MTIDLLIDGYNLMHAAGIARRMARPGELESWRHRLVKRVSQNLSPAERAVTLIVFDAKEAPDIGGRNDLMEGIRIQYAPPGREADDLLEDLIQEHRQPAQLRVISSDHRIQKAARRRKCKFLDSDRFLDELDVRQHHKAPEKPVVDPPPQRGRRLKPVAEAPTANVPAKPEAGDADYWLKEFGDIEIPTISPDEAEPLPEPVEEQSKPKSAKPRPSQPAAGADILMPRQPAQRRVVARPKDDEPAKPVDPVIGDAAFWQKRINELHNE